MSEALLYELEGFLLGRGFAGLWVAGLLRDSPLFGVAGYAEQRLGFCGSEGLDRVGGGCRVAVGVLAGVVGCLLFHFTELL